MGADGPLESHAGDSFAMRVFASSDLPHWSAEFDRRKRIGWQSRSFVRNPNATLTACITRSRSSSFLLTGDRPLPHHSADLHVQFEPYAARMLCGLMALSACTPISARSCLVSVSSWPVTESALNIRTPKKGILPCGTQVPVANTDKNKHTNIYTQHPHAHQHVHLSIPPCKNR